jgi:hypothetical protein
VLDSFFIYNLSYVPTKMNPFFIDKGDDKLKSSRIIRN